MLYLESRKQWNRIIILFELSRVLRHHLGHKARSPIKHRGLVNQDFLNVTPQVIPEGSDD